MLATLWSEWGKTWSIRSPLICLAGAMALTVATAMTLANDFLHSMRIGETPPDATLLPIDVVTQAVLTGLVVFAAFAMLPVTSEYTTGTIYSTLRAQPQRLRVLPARRGSLASLAYCSAL